jgi:arylsulfatase
LVRGGILARVALESNERESDMTLPRWKYALAAFALAGPALIPATANAQQPRKPNIVIIWGDDIGQSNVSAYSRGMMGYRTPNIDRIANEGTMFTDYYAEQSCTAGRASFITGQSGLRTGMTKVGLPGATLGLQKEDPTIAELIKPLGYATGQFGKNHLGDSNEYLPTVHGFDEFYGNPTTSTPRKNPNCRTIRRTRRSAPSSDPAA